MLRAGPYSNGWFQVQCGTTTYFVAPDAMRPNGAALPAAAKPGGGTTAHPADTALPRAIPTGPYRCWAFNTARLTLNFTVTGPGRYRASDGSIGGFTYDAGSGAVHFTGFLAGAIPAGWQAVFHQPQGRPTVSFRNRGTEAAFCQRG